MPGSADSRRRRWTHERDRDRDHDRDSPRDSPKDREKSKHHSSRSSRKVSSSSVRDRESDKYRERERDHEGSYSTRSSRTPTAPEMERRASSLTSPSGSKISTPYPSFSKAHSKEAVGVRGEKINPRLSLYTPDPTDLGSEAFGTKSSTERRTPATAQAEVPPSPPLTAQDPDLRHSKSGNSIRVTSDTTSRTRNVRATSLDGSPHPRSGTRKSHSKSSLRSSTVYTPSKKYNKSPLTSEMRVPSGGARKASPSVGSNPASVLTQSTTDSQATPVPHPAQASVGAETNARSSSPSTTSSPHTPHAQDPTFPVGTDPFVKPKQTDLYTPSVGNSPQTLHQVNFTSATTSAPPPPPPPPPPAPVNADVPQVDYLLQYGGLPYTVPKSFLDSIAATSPTSPYQPMPYSKTTTTKRNVENIFSPFHKTLENYLQVISKNGSVAVATGYRSVARRLLDRLEQVFNRNISDESCACIMCLKDPESQKARDEGVSWGEILEYVSGRRVLPPWPPFTISSEVPDLVKEVDAPMQKIDVDVPPEYRDHFIRQSKKTKQMVQNWLTSQPEIPSSPPQEIDNETLVFAMITYLEPENRRLFTALLRGMSTFPNSRAPTPMDKERSELMSRTALALQRLYRLRSLPRDAECSIYLLKNPYIHGVLSTLAAISNHEWDILVSGRFDGFLWSGTGKDGLPFRGATPANNPISSPVPSRSASARPFSPPPSRPTPSSTPFSTASTSATPWGTATTPATPAPAATPALGAPVQLDEDTEIAALAEVEREIYAGMDALEDAFELLHNKAEQVRAALRARGAGLAMGKSARRGSVTEGPRATLGTPAVGTGICMGGVWGLESEDDGLDSRSELAPDDSASNVSGAVGRRRRREVRTPGVVREEG